MYLDTIKFVYLLIINLKHIQNMPRPKDTKTKIVVQIQPFNQKSINYSIRLKDGVSIADGLQEIIKQLKNK